MYSWCISMEMAKEALQEKARELADMVGSVVVDEALLSTPPIAPK